MTRSKYVMMIHALTQTWSGPRIRYFTAPPAGVDPTQIWSQSFSEAPVTAFLYIMWAVEGTVSFLTAFDPGK